MDNLTHLNSFKNVGHLVLSPSDKDEEKFKLFIPFIINWIETKKSIAYYSISEEMGEKNNYHLDIILFSNSDINNNILNNKGKYLGLQGEIRKHKDNHLPNTIMSEHKGGPYYHYQNEHKDKTHEFNVKFCIGYNYKEQNGILKNWNNLNLTEEIIQETIKFYNENETKSAYIKQKDTIPLNSKNIMHEMKKFISDKENYNLKNLKLDTVKKGYCWAGTTKRMVRSVVLQLKILSGEANEYEEAEFSSDLFPEIKDDIVDQLNNARFQSDKRIRLNILHELKFITTSEYYSITGEYP